MYRTRAHSLLSATLLSVWMSGCVYEPPQPLLDPDPVSDEECALEARVSCGADGDLYWVDSCGRRGEKQSECPSEFACIAGPPARCSTPPTVSCLEVLNQSGEGGLELIDFGPKMIGRAAHKQLTLESCGDQTLVVTALNLSGDESFVIETPPALPLLIEPGERVTLDVAFTPNEVRLHQATLSILSDDPYQAQREVRLMGLGLIDPCPRPAVIEEERVVEPLQVVTLDASPSTSSEGGAQGLRYQWVVLSRPPGSSSQPVESLYNPSSPADGGPPDNTSTPSALFFVDLIGEYQIELQLTDPTGYRVPSEECGESSTLVITAKTEDEIHIELTWRTPNDPDETDFDGTDLDLHLLHPHAFGWNDTDLDCHYQNRVPSWGAPGPAGDASLDIDDTNGAGPENIHVNDPEDTSLLGGPYQIGVHYYSPSVFGPSEAQIRVFLAGELDAVYTRTLLERNNMWLPAVIHWTPTVQRSEVRDELYEQLP